MIKITNRVLACWDGKFREKPKVQTSTIIIHRIGPELGGTAEELAEKFRDTKRHAAGSYTGGEFPYHFVLFPDGRIEQALALEDTGVHAIVWNKVAIAIALSGDYHLNQDPTPVLWENTVNLAALLAWWLGAYHLYGHTELGPSATKDPTKRCPGAHISMDDLRAQVVTRLHDVTPGYNKLSKDLVLCARSEYERIGGYGIVIRRVDGMT